TGLLEDADGPPLPLVDGAAEAAVPAAGMVTLALAGPAETGQRPGGTGPAAPDDAPPEPGQPVFSRYWLHGKGPAPAGTLPVAAHLPPGRVAPGPAPTGTATTDTAAALRLTVACGPVPASGQVSLDVPPGVAVEPAASGPAPLRYDLAGGSFARWDLRV